MEVNITTPAYVLDSEWGVAGSFFAEWVYNFFQASYQNWI